MLYEVITVLQRFGQSVLDCRCSSDQLRHVDDAVFHLTGEVAGDFLAQIAAVVES